MLVRSLFVLFLTEYCHCFSFFKLLNLKKFIFLLRWIRHYTNESVHVRDVSKTDLFWLRCTSISKVRGLPHWECRGLVVPRLYRDISNLNLSMALGQRWVVILHSLVCLYDLILSSKLWHLSILDLVVTFINIALSRLLFLPWLLLLLDQAAKRNLAFWDHHLLLSRWLLLLSADFKILFKPVLHTFLWGDF